MASKRKHYEVTLKIKYNVLNVAKEYNILTSTLATWKKTKKKIIEAFENLVLKRQRRVKTDKYDKLNDALFKLFKSIRGNNIPINGSISSEKAHGFAKSTQISSHRILQY